MSTKTSPRRATQRRRQQLATVLRDPRADVRALDLMTLGGQR